MNKKNIVKLNTNLRQFGLNPHEWVIRPLASNRFQILNRWDADLKLIGQGHITAQGIQWNSLTWSH